MEVSIFGSTLIGMAAGVIGTGAGAVVAWLIGARGKRAVSVVMEFSAGLMLAVVCFDLLPHALDLCSLPLCIVGFLLGVAMALYVQDLIKYKKGLKDINHKGLLGTAFVVMAGVALHNFPEGLAIGSGFDVSERLGLAITLVIALHNIPEGLSMALPMRFSGWRPLKTLVYTAATGLPMGLGALIGSAAGSISADAVGLCLAMAGGAMLYIVCGDILPESMVLYRGRLPALGGVLGFVVGMLVSLSL